jgi:hypothetical protein
MKRGSTTLTTIATVVRARDDGCVFRAVLAGGENMAITMGRLRCTRAEAEGEFALLQKSLVEIVDAARRVTSADALFEIRRRHEEWLQSATDAVRAAFENDLVEIALERLAPKDSVPLVALVDPTIGQEVGWMLDELATSQSRFRMVQAMVGRCEEAQATTAQKAEEERHVVESLLVSLSAFRDATRRLRAGRSKKPGRGLKPRNSYLFDDEYDVQDALIVYLKMAYSDVRDEDPTQKNAGSSSKLDFIIPSLATGIEVKHVRNDTNIAQLKKELLVDINDCSAQKQIHDLVFFVTEAYDANVPTDALHELEKLSLPIRVHIVRVRL